MNVVCLWQGDITVLEVSAAFLGTEAGFGAAVAGLARASLADSLSAAV